MVSSLDKGFGNKLEKFCPWIEKNIAKTNKNKLQNGIIYLKGGDLNEEIQKVSKKYNFKIEKIINYFEDSFFESKSILYLYKK